MNKRTRNRVAKVYVDAARLINGKYNPEGCCISIGWVTCAIKKSEFNYLGLFAKTFGKRKPTHKYWWPMSTSRTIDAKERREITPRIIALCLMAELVRDGQFDEHIQESSL